MKETDVKLFKDLMNDPILFVEKMWGLTPQPVKKEFKKKYKETTELSNIKPEWFKEFKRGKHITWQQTIILRAVRRAVKGKDLKRISVASGHGIGKDACLSWLILWYLFTRKEAQVPCTAPTSDQMFDILWKEIKKWLNRMPEAFANKYEWQNQHIRVKESPETWFARAKTARKENTEALAGVHGDYVFLVADEAGGVEEAIFETAEGALTNEDILFMLIGNPTQTDGYFYDSHFQDSHNWQNFQFSSENSPIVDPDFKRRIEEKYGKDSNEYRIRVEGKFAKEEQIDDQGWMMMIKHEEIRKAMERDFEASGKRRLGVDVARAGGDFNVWYLRTNNKAWRIRKDQDDDLMSVAQTTKEIIKDERIPPNEVFIDDTGLGGGVTDRLTEMGYPVNPINFNSKADDPDKYRNIKAECYDKAVQWIKEEGAIEFSKEVMDQIKYAARYKKTSSGKIQIKPKRLLRKKNKASPDDLEALFLTFAPKTRQRPRWDKPVAPQQNKYYPEIGF